MTSEAVKARHILTVMFICQKHRTQRSRFTSNESDKDSTDETDADSDDEEVRTADRKRKRY